MPRSQGVRPNRSEFELRFNQESPWVAGYNRVQREQAVEGEAAHIIGLVKHVLDNTRQRPARILAFKPKPQIGERIAWKVGMGVDGVVC